MTYEEIFDEVAKDFESVKTKFSYIKKGLARYARRQVKYPAVHFSEYISPRKNRWIIISIFYRRNIHNGGAGVAFACLQKSDKGGYMVHEVVVNKFRKCYLATFHPHFFDRYREHMGVDKTGIDLIRHFFGHNHEGSTDFTSEYSGKQSRHKNAYHVCLQEGIGLGEVLASSHALITTFITYDMAAGEQKEAFDKLYLNADDAAKRHRKLWCDKLSDIDEYLGECLDEWNNV